MNINKMSKNDTDYPCSLSRIASPPKQLFWQGEPLECLLNKPRVTIIGSRSMSAYGRRVTEQLASDLATQGIVIISGLALGVDTAAHQSALRAGGQCIAVLPSCIEQIVPRSNLNLAQNILDNRGTLISEYGASQPTFKQNFVARNRIMAGLADAVLITEASLKSGTMHTARFALEQGIDVLAVPGNIYNPLSEGTNSLIRAGATPITKIEDVLAVLGLETKNMAKKRPKVSNKNQQIIIDLMVKGENNGENLLQMSELDISIFNQALTMLEITGKIRALGANSWTIA